MVEREALLVEGWMGTASGERGTAGGEVDGHC